MMPVQSHGHGTRRSARLVLLERPVLLESTPDPFFAPKGATGCSHGWSGVRQQADGAQPVEDVVDSRILPRRGRGTVLRPSGARREKSETPSHGFRGGGLRRAAAPPVATTCGPFGAESACQNLAAAESDT